MQTNFLQKTITLLALILCLTAAVQAQTKIGAPGAPDPTAILELSSTSRGLLTSRMTTVQRDAIASPANGLLIYNTDTGCFNYYADGTGTSTAIAAWYTFCDGVGLGTLGGADPLNPNAACTPIVVNGIYTQGVGATASNYITVQVNVTNTGSYTIATPVVNDFSFSGTGVFTSTGIQSVNLYAQGTPTNAGTSTFAVTYGTQTCNVDIPVQTPPATVAAGTLSCTGTLSGTYTVGQVTTGSNTKVISVNVSTPGSYSFLTNTVAGVSFSASGTFASTGVQNVTLVASGTPNSSGTFGYTVMGLSQSCSFTVPVSSTQYYMLASPSTNQAVTIGSDIAFTSSINSNVSVTGANITLKANRRYRIKVGLYGYPTAANDVINYNIVDAANATIATSTAGQILPVTYNAGNNANNNTATAVVNVGGTDIIIKIRVTSVIGSGVILAAYSYLTIQEIKSGDDYVIASHTTSQVVAASGTDVTFTSLANSGTSVSGASITLKAGKTYRLEAALYAAAFSALNAGYANYGFVDASNVLLTTSTVGQALPTTYPSTTNGPNNKAVAFVTVGGTDIVVKLRTFNGSGNGTLINGYCYLSVEEIAAGSQYAFGIAVNPSNVPGATDISFNSSANSGASVSGANITLKAGKTYLVSSSLYGANYTGVSTDGFFNYGIVLSSNAFLPAHTLAQALSVSYAGVAAANNTATAIVAVGAADIVVKIRVLYFNGTSVLVSDYSYVSVVELP